MAKDEYTELLQSALRKEVERLFNNEWQIEGYKVKKEHSKLDMPGKFNGFVDIGIRDEDLQNVLIAIEIEHKSNREQAMKNIYKLKTWAHNSIDRKCGLLQLFNEECNPSEDDICRIVDFARRNQKKDKGFHYEYTFYKLRSRKAETVAKEIVKSKNFRTRLYQLLKYVESCE